MLTTHSADSTTYTYDMGVNMVGVPTFTIPKGTLQAGDEVIFRFGETIYPGNSDSPNTMWPGGDPRNPTMVPYSSIYGPDGTYRPGVAGRILTDSYRAAMALDRYKASAADANRDVVITPNFTFRGYQYIEITVPRRTTALPLEDVEGIVLSSIDIPEGSYEATTSDDNYTGKLANQFFKNAQRSQLGNFFSLPTDCPQRNERMGWTGDLQAYARSATYNSSYDTQAFLRQWLIALRDAQGVNGGIGDTVPIISLTGDRGTNYPQSPTWEGAVSRPGAVAALHPVRRHPGDPGELPDHQEVARQLPCQRRGAEPRLPGADRPHVRQRRSHQHGRQHPGAHGRPGDVPVLPRHLLQDG